MRTSTHCQEQQCLQARIFFVTIEVETVKHGEIGKEFLRE
jgi:hypothetical protein